MKPKGFTDYIIWLYYKTKPKALLIIFQVVILTLDWPHLFVFMDSLTIFNGLDIWFIL